METSSAVAAFLAQAQARGLSHKTIDSYSWALRHITSETLPTEAGQVETILAQAIPRLASESLYDLWRVLRTFHRWARIRYDIPDPTSHVAAPRRAALLPRALSPADMRDLLEVCQSQRNRLLILVPLDTGLRLAETPGFEKTPWAPPSASSARAARPVQSPSAPVWSPNCVPSATRIPPGQPAPVLLCL